MANKSLMMLVAVSLVPTLTLASVRMQTASPGERSHPAEVHGICPTFSWGLVPEALVYELVVYRLDAEGEPGSNSPILVRRLPGSVTTWTPAVGECLQSGHEYGWSIRAGLDADVTGWSEALFFRTRDAPSVSEIREALGVLRRALPDLTLESERAADPLRPRAFEPAPPLVPTQASRLDVTPPSAGSPALGPDISLSVDADISLDAVSDVFKDGAVFLYDEGSVLGLGREALAANTVDIPMSEGINNTGLGFKALSSNTSGSDNTAVGKEALTKNALPSRNTAVGSGALASLTDIGPSGGGDNTAVGAFAMSVGSAIDISTAIGSRALEKLNGAQGNTAVGASALQENINGPFNTAVGLSALRLLDMAQPGFGDNGGNVAVGTFALDSLKEGESNIAVGDSAGSNLGSGIAPVTSMSHNIYLGSFGRDDEEHTMRLGTPFVSGPGFVQGQTQTFVAGILGNTAAGTHEVHIRANGELVEGPAVVSSRRFKRNIEVIGSRSGRLWDLRPVTYQFAENFSGDASEAQFGLIAEEVAEIFPELVDYDAEGRPYSVKYRFLAVLLLNELQLLKDRLGGELVPVAGAPSDSIRY